MNTTPPSDGGIEASLTGSPTLPTREAQEETRELIALDADQLAATRKSAEAWRAGLGGLTAIVTGALFIKGKESVDDLGDDAKLALAILVFGAIACGVAGTYLALRAANGQPKATLTEDIASDGASAFRRKLALEAVKDLRQSQILAAAAVVLLCAGVLLTWFAEKPTPDPLAQVKVTAGGSEICGTSKGISGGSLRLEVAGNVRRVRVASLQAVQLVADCE